MAIASYTTDLFTITEAESLTNFAAIGGGAAGLNVEQEYFLQNIACISKNGHNSTAARGFVFDSGSAFSIQTGSAIFYWGIWAAPNALNTQTAGGFQALAGIGSGDFNAYYIKGSDTYTYGGWFNVPVDPEYATADTVVGTPGAFTSWDTVGVRTIQNGNVTKGSPLGMDVVRHGRRLFVTNGDATAYGTFLSSSIVNDEQNNRWGLLQAIDGGYLQQGIFQIGSGSTSCDFRDSNKNISISNTEYVSPSFNRFEFVNTGTNVEWSSINVNALGTNAPGDFLITDNITGSFTQCTFANMGYFTLKPNSTFTSTTFRNCKTLIQSGSTLDTCTIPSANIQSGSAFIISDTPNTIQDCTFTYDAGHAVEITKTGSFTFSGNIFNNYLADETSGSALFNNTGGPVTMSIVDASSPTVRNGPGSTTLISADVAITVDGLKDNTEVRVFDSATSNPQVELAGVENATDGTTDDRSFTFSLGAGTIIDIAIINVTYENTRIDAYTVPGSAATLPVSQRFDRNFNNP